ncbi:MAG: type II toxin-antitoxin system VapC family toxin [Synechococcaceae cyanobacterium]|nr:type II toxin-antitoxin system VapC family toxin [Synechococcaceae cyanobacterium]
MRPRYLLDTNICIHVIKGDRPGLRRRLAQHPSQRLAMSVITYGELVLGVERSQRRAHSSEALVLLRRSIHVLSLPVDAGEHYGRIGASLQAQGTPIGANDLWIAAHALAADLTLVSNNTSAFERVDALRLENWSC